MDPGGAVEVPETPLVRGLRSGSVAFVITAAAAQLFAWITASDLPGEPFRLVQVVKLGAIYLVGFLGATQSWSVTDPILATAQIAVPLLTGTILIVVLGARCRDGIGVATLTFSLLCTAFAIVVAAAPLVVADGSLRIAPLWWVVFVRACLLFGVPAALSALARRSPAARTAVGGGWRMVAGTVLATGILMIALLPMQRAISDGAFFGFRRLGDPGGTAASLNNALVYPSEAATVATVAMGGCAGIGGPVGTGREVCGLREALRGRSDEPAGTLGIGSFAFTPPAIPAGYAWFVLGPLIGIGFGGWWVGHRAREGSAASAALAGAGAGGVAVVLFLVVAALASVRIADVDVGPITGEEWRLGPFAMSLVLPGVVWCVVLGSVGALLGRAVTRAVVARRSVAQHESASSPEESAERGERDPD